MYAGGAHRDRPEHRERIHKANLINFGILPLALPTLRITKKIAKGDVLAIDDIHQTIRSPRITVRNITQGTTFEVVNETSSREQEIILAGGLLNFATTK